MNKNFNEKDSRIIFKNKKDIIEITIVTIIFVILTTILLKIVFLASSVYAKLDILEKEIKNLNQKLETSATLKKEDSTLVKAALKENVNNTPSGSITILSTGLTEYFDSISEETKNILDKELNNTSYTNRWNITLTEDEIDLLARIVWVEARGESLEGQQAVVEVVFNRMVSDIFKENTLYDTLSAKRQFSSWKIKNTAKDYETQIEVVRQVLSGKTNVLSMDTYYFAMFPHNKNLKKKIGNHYFCGEY